MDEPEEHPEEHEPQQRRPPAWRRPWVVVPTVLGAVVVVIVLAVVGVIGGSGTETTTVEGTFVLYDEDEFFSGSCSGSGGYGDIRSNTAVVVRDIREEVITRTELGTGEGDGSTCVFTFDVELVEGSDGGDGFVVAVGDRGESTYTWEEIQEPGAVSLVLGLD